jgi:hypothetical protein
VRRATIALVVVTLALAGVVVGGVALYRAYDRTTASTGCTFAAFSTDTGQAAIASTLVGVVVTRGLPERAAVLVIAAALQESKLRNIPDGQGDRDSVGVLQQRPSQGWGTPAQLADPKYAAGAFLNHLVEVANWQTMPLADAIQTVQVSADGSAYAKHEARAQAIADALTGATPRGIDCRFAVPTQVAPVATVASQLRSALPVQAPSAAGRRVSVPGASWTSAAWFVANADRLGIDEVDYAGYRWRRDAGWQADPSAARTAVVAVLH